MKCKVLDCKGKGITEEESFTLFFTKKYKGYCGLHAKDRYRADEIYRKEEEEEKKREEE